LGRDAGVRACDRLLLLLLPPLLLLTRPLPPRCCLGIREIQLNLHWKSDNVDKDD